MDHLQGTPDLQARIALAREEERHARHAAAREQYEHGLRELRGPQPASLAAELTRWIGRTYWAEGDFDAARDCLEASLAIARLNADLPGVAHARNLQAIVSQHLGRLDDALDGYEDALSTAREAGDQRLEALVENNLGIIATIRGDVDTALEHYLRALGGFRGLAMEDEMARALNNLGMIYTDLQCWSEAEAAFDEAIEMCAASGNLPSRIMLEVNRAELWIAQRSFERARECCEAAFALAHRVGDARALAEIQKHLGVIYRELGNYGRAEVFLAAAARAAEGQGDRLLAAETAREQAELFWLLHRSRETLQCLNRAHHHFADLRASLDLVDVERRHAKLQSSYLAIVSQWSQSIEAADGYTQGHCERVANAACALARAAGVDHHTLLWFRMGALLHDVGKIIVPSEILNKAGALTPDERALIEQHPDAGVELLSGIDFPWDIRPMVRFHHERWDGRGYPMGLAGEEIPLAARILCIADVYDALTTDRPYRKGFSPERSLEIMAEQMRGHFDPRLFELFQGICRRQADFTSPELAA